MKVAGFGIGAVLVILAIAADFVLGGAPGFGRSQTILLLTGISIITVAAVITRTRHAPDRPALREAVQPRLPTRRLWLFRSVALVIATLIAAILGELIIRVFVPQLTFSRLLELTGEQYVTGDFIPFTLKPSYRATAPSMEHREGRVTVSTNALGLRGPEISLEKPAGTRRVLVLGDSYTFGVYVEDHETYPAVLEKCLNRNQDARVEVINAGYADGWSPDEHYAWLLNRGLAFEPDVVIYGFFVGNDVDGYNMLERSVRWSDLDERGLPRRVENPEIYVDPVGRIRSRVRDGKTVGAELVYRVPVLRESHLAVATDSVAERLFRKYLSSSKAWSEPMLFVFSEQNSPRMDAEEQLFKRLVRGMADVCANHHIPFVVLMIPVNVQVDPSLPVWGNSDLKPKRDYFQEIAPWFEEQRIRTINMLKLMRQIPGKYYPANGEVHCNPAGNRFIGEQLAKWLVENSLLERAQD